MNINRTTYANNPYVNNPNANNPSGKADTMKEAIDYIKNMVNFGMDEADEQKLKEKYDAKIQAKLESGKRLSQKELQYLSKYNPVMYAHAMRIEVKRRSVEEQLKHARSKREVEEIQMQAISSVSKEDPVKQYMIAAIEETVKAFKETDSYKRLPEVEDPNKKDPVNKIRNKEEDDSEDSEEGTASITYEYSDGKLSAGSYQMAFADSNEIFGEFYT